MAKKIKAIVKLQIPAGQANPAPPVGPALGQHGLNIMGFCKEYNERTAAQAGMIIPVEITVYDDRILHFHHQDAAHLRPPQEGHQAPKASGHAGHDEAGTITKDKLREIAGIKMKDLNANSIEAAERTVAGTARSMGIKVE